MDINQKLLLDNKNQPSRDIHKGGMTKEEINVTVFGGSATNENDAEIDIRNARIDREPTAHKTNREIRQENEKNYQLLVKEGMVNLEVKGMICEECGKILQVQLLHDKNAKPIVCTRCKCRGFIQWLSKKDINRFVSNGNFTIPPVVMAVINREPYPERDFTTAADIKNSRDDVQGKIYDEIASYHKVISEEKKRVAKENSEEWGGSMDRMKQRLDTKTNKVGVNMKVTLKPDGTILAVSFGMNRELEFLSEIDLLKMITDMANETINNTVSFHRATTRVTKRG